MSGIAAVLEHGGRPLPPGLFATLSLAAPDLSPAGTWTWEGPSVGFVRCRSLATPEDDDEPPPYPDPADGSAIVADLRLDNRDELLGRLGVPAGARPGDAALALACYRAWGTEGFAALVGDFALAIWDARRRALVCARDPLGMRPLFYQAGTRRFVAGSALKQVFADAEVPRRLSDRAIAGYLSAARPDPGETLFESVRRLEPGHWIEVDRSGTTRTGRYWDPGGFGEDGDSTDDELAAGFRERLARAVSARLRSRSVKVGLHVSGGLDSSAVAAVALDLDRRNGLGLEPCAFVTYARHPKADERRYIGEFLDRYPMPVVAYDAEDFWAFRHVPDSARWHDGPHQPEYVARLFAQCTAARERGISVILSGNGGDEVGGNSWYLIDRLRRGRLRGTWGELEARARGKRVSPWRLARNMASLSARWSRTRLSGRLPRQSSPAWLGPVAARHRPEPRAVRRSGSLDPVRDSTLDAIESIQAEPLVAGFRELYAQFGVEVRSPFLDRRLFEWALAVPGHRFGARGLVKAPFRRGLADLLPEAIRDRADKGNYLEYVHLGLRDKERPRIERLLERPVSAELGYLDADALRLAYSAYCGGENIHLGHLWNALTLESWLRERPGPLH